MERYKPGERPKSPAGIALACSACAFLLLFGTLALIEIEYVKVLLAPSQSVNMTVLDDEENSDAQDGDEPSETPAEQRAVAVPVSPPVVAAVTAPANILLPPVVCPLGPEAELIPVDPALFDLARAEYQEADILPVTAPPAAARTHRPSGQTAKPPSAAPSAKPSRLARYKHTPLPPYPKSARQAGLEGIVILLIHVDKDGYPQRVSISQPSGIAALDDASVQWVARNWTFYPAINENDMPVECDVMAPIRFQLN